MSALPAASNVTIIPPRPDNLHEAIDMLHTSQITGDYRYNAMAMAGPLMSEAGAIFPLHMILIYLTTSYKRRQVAALPKQLQNYDLAKQIKTLLFMIDTLAQGDDIKYEKLCSNVVEAAKRGHSISSVLKQAYYQTKFPDPLVPNSENCKHISSCDGLRKAAHQFNNCLRDYCEEGIRGEYQYYRWFENNRPVAVISLREDSPYGFRIFEIQGKRNVYIEDELESKIIKHFEAHDVHKMSSMESLLRELGGVC